MKLKEDTFLLNKRTLPSNLLFLIIVVIDEQDAVLVALQS